MKQAQGQAIRALQATHSLEVSLKTLEKRDAAEDAALARQLAAIDVTQVTTNSELRSLARTLNALRQELRAQQAAAAHARAPQTPQPPPSATTATSAASQTTAVIAPSANSAMNAIYAKVSEKADQIALGKTSAPTPSQAPQSLAGLSYGDYESIRYVGKTPPWSGRDFFELKFFPAGFVFQHGTLIHLVGRTSSPALELTPGAFRWPSDLNAPLPSTIPIAGFGVSQSYGASETDFFLAFRGASYFQAAAPGEPFGLSARGIAIDTGVPNTAEEFPRFTEYWLGASSGAQFDVVALLSGSSVTGSYRFQIQPLATRTIMYISTKLYLLRNVAEFGLAPLTSMYLEGPDSLHRPDSRANAVHDSDGLLIHEAAGWMWVPLDNPQRLRMIDIPVTDLHGFGLLQRARDYSDYRVPDGGYQDHPDAWVQPSGNWGAGSIKLIELPAQYPSNDNIVAFWAPANPPAPKEAFNFAYRLTWSMAGPSENELGRVLGTRIALLKNGRYAFMISYGDGDLDNLPDWVNVTPDISATDKSITASNVSLRKIAETGHWRLSFELPAGAGDQQVSAVLRYGNRVLTERWVRQLPGS